MRVKIIRSLVRQPIYPLKTRQRQGTEHYEWTIREVMGGVGARKKEQKTFRATKEEEKCRGCPLPIKFLHKNKRSKSKFACNLKVPLPPFPHHFSNGPSLRKVMGRGGGGLGLGNFQLAWFFLALNAGLLV